MVAPSKASAGRTALPPARGLLTLGIETGGDHLSLSLVDWRGPGDFELREEVTSFRAHRHADVILARIAEMLQQHAFSASDIGLVAVGRGPGGFTGIRVGLSTALGLSLATSVPVWPVCSLESLAVEAAALAGPWNNNETRLVAPAIDARRGEVYGAVYEVSADLAVTVVLPPAVTGLAAFRALVAEHGRDHAVEWVGTGAVAAGLARSSRLHLGSATRHALLAAAAWDRCQRDPRALPPLDAAYLRKSEAELNAEKALDKRTAIGD